MQKSQTISISVSYELQPDRKHWMPSCVPDFSVPQIGMQIDTGSATRPSSPKYKCLPGNVLHVRGTPVGCLQDVQEVLLGNHNGEHALDAI